MEKNSIIHKKGAVIAVIVLLIGVSIIPSISGNVNKPDDVKGVINKIRMKNVCSEIETLETINGEEPNYFELYEIISFQSIAWGLTTADFNREDNIDFAVYASTWTSGMSISIFYNDGELGFTNEAVYGSSRISDIDSADYDKDGDIDILFTRNEVIWYGGVWVNVNGTVNLLLNDGENNFATPILIAKHPGTPYDPENRINPQLSSADYDMDGDIDFLVGDNSGKIEFYLNNGSGNFTSAGVINDWGHISWGVTSADYDNDGDIDFLVAAETDDGFDGFVYLKRNQMIESNFTICFEPGPGQIIARTGSRGCLVSFDYENDGDMDFIAGLGQYVFIFINKQEVFYPFYIYKLPKSPEGYADDLSKGALTVGDFNNDGYDDFITGGVQGVVRLFINNYGKTPTVSIEKPVEKQLYIFDKSVISLLTRTIILRKITVEAKSTVAAQNVEFYVDGVLEYSVTEYPYEWLWNKLSFGEHTLKIVAYDTDENYIAEDEITVWKFF